MQHAKHTRMRVSDLALKSTEAEGVTFQDNNFALLKRNGGQTMLRRKQSTGQLRASQVRASGDAASNALNFFKPPKLSCAGPG